MATTKHSPSPWTFSGQGDYSAITDAEDNQIAEVHWLVGMSLEQLQANTKLFAAAPDLLAALEELNRLRLVAEGTPVENMLTALEGIGPAWLAAKAAIAKARSIV